MSIYSGYVIQSTDDHDTLNGSGLTTIRTQRNRDGGGAPVNWADAHTKIDTSGLSGLGITITAATLHWYNHSYSTTPKADPEGSYVSIWDGSSYTQIQSITSNRVVGWESHALTTGELAHIVTTAHTSFRYLISDPVTFNQTRQWAIRAWDYSSATTYSARLVVGYDTTIPTSGAPGFIQSKANNNGASGSISVTLDSAPTEGNWLVAALCERSTVPSGSSMVGDGWTYDGYERIATDDSTYRRGMAIYHKLVRAVDSGTTIEGTFDNALGGATIHVAEFSGLTSFDQIGFSGNGTTSNDTTLASSAITTDQSTAMIAMYGFKCSSNDPSGGGGCSYSDGFSEGASHVSTIIHSFYNSVGWVDAEISGTTGTTITINESTTTNNGIICALLSFNTTLDEEEPPVDTRRRAALRFISCS